MKRTNTPTIAKFHTHYLYEEKKNMRTKVDVFAFSLHDFNTYGVFVACTAHANQFQMEKEE